MNLDQLLGRRTLEVPCRVSIVNSNESLEAHVELEGVTVEPGDQVCVIDPPTEVTFGESLVCERRATVTRGGWYDRLWAHVSALFELNELYDLSFTPRRQL